MTPTGRILNEKWIVSERPRLRIPFWAFFCMRSAVLPPEKVSESVDTKPEACRCCGAVFWATILSRC